MTLTWLRHHQSYRSNSVVASLVTSHVTPGDCHVTLQVKFEQSRDFFVWLFYVSWASKAITWFVNVQIKLSRDILRKSRDFVTLYCAIIRHPRDLLSRDILYFGLYMYVCIELSCDSLIKSHHFQSKSEHLLFTHVYTTRHVTSQTDSHVFYANINICKNNPIWTITNHVLFASTKNWYLILQLLILIRTWHWKLWQCKYVICGNIW